jgi:hypothetical protein
MDIAAGFIPLSQRPTAELCIKMIARRIFGGLLVLVCMIGCDSEPRRYGVSGTVTYKNAPVKFGTIDFRASDGTTGAAQIVDGKYDIPSAGGLTPGSYRVAIGYPDPKIPMPTGNAPPGEVLPIREMLPKKYNDETELTAEIKAVEKNPANFDLK